MAGDFYRMRGALRRLIDDLGGKSQSGMDLAMERMFALQPETYLRYEERFSELVRLLDCLRAELDAVQDWGALDRIQRRVYFLEERFEDVDSVLRNRPRKFRSRISMDRLFRVSSRTGNRQGPLGDGDIRSFEEALHVLGMDEGAQFPEIRRRFRKLMKELHPDIRMGDRSAEGQMRSVLSAYEFLKQKMMPP
ncbi:MAG: J domain-containing protein [Leptospirales bacterium]